MANQQIGMIVLGAGKASYLHAIAAKRVAEIKLHGVYDVNSAAAQQHVQKLGGVAYGSLESALDQRGACIAVICTPPGTHIELAAKALEAGLHPLVEKPFALNVSNLEAIERKARQQGLVIGAVAQHRFAADAVTLRNLYRQLLPEQVLYIDLIVQRHRPAEFFETSWHNWRESLDLSGGGVLITIGFHYLDLLCWIAGETPRQIWASYGESTGPIESAIVGRFNLGPVVCNVQARWGDIEATKDQLKIVTTQQTITFTGDQLSVGGAAEQLDRYELHARQLRDFAGAVLNQQAPAISPTDVQPALELIFNLYESARAQWRGA